MNFSFEIFMAFASLLATIILGTVVVTNQNKNRAQRDFFIKEIGRLKSDYADFISEIRCGKLSSRQISSSFLSFSGRILMLNEIIAREYRINQNEVFRRHGEFQAITTDMESISDQFENASVTLNPDELLLLTKSFHPLDRALIELVIEINKASVFQPWERDDFLDRPAI